ncbi:MAG: Glu-tRNA(Gln) amidotransferase subunit GatE, partial [Promethearchaeota archaeon]
MAQHNYEKLGLKCGLEIHQQLETESKLFCRCPSTLQGTRKPDFEVKRQMRPVLGEMGTYDKAMLTEYSKGMDIVYEGYNDVICTYELDEAPPFPCNTEARKIALKIALLLNANIIEEMHVCRKNYLDGSVPCGFQKTMILGTDGYIPLESGKKIRIDILSLEEEAARRIKTLENTNYYRLDRLGIPLIEVTTKPDIATPQECRECAERIGLLLWMTKVKTVIGSIRQDINVSIKSGTRIEIKGVQKLGWIPTLINHEVSRQTGLVQIKTLLDERRINLEETNPQPTDLTEKLIDCNSDFIVKGIKSGNLVYGINFLGFKGIFGKELMEDYRFGTEISSKVKVLSGLKGIIHSDENLKSYQFSNKDVKTIVNALNSEKEDCFVLVMGPKKKVEKAVQIILTRVKYAFKGVPPETRKALENGNTEFLRDLHGGARLYPDTDSPAINNLKSEIEEVEKEIPQYPWIIIDDYSKKYNTEARLIKKLIFKGKLTLFERLVEIYPENPSIILTTLLETSKALRREGKKIELIKETDYISIFTELSKKNIGKEIIEDIMRMKTEKPEFSVSQIKDELHIESISLTELQKIISKIVEKNIDLIKERENRSLGPL